MFIDKAKIHIKAGDGADGTTSFYRTKFTRYPKPDGGDGGDGGDIIFIADENLHSLLDFKYRTFFHAGSGRLGSSSQKKGARGKDCIIKVPPGTILKDPPTGNILRDMVVPNQQIVVLKGGKAGRGNRKNNSATPGEPGQGMELLLELKLIADAGIIGFPNAGKSTLICHISNAKSKVASFPFTTKSPVLGVVDSKYSDYNFVVADIPGLIEGAHKGRGLGDEFLRHIERTHILIHMVDIAAVDGRDPIQDFHSLNKELKLYNPQLSKRHQIIVANKMDLPQAEPNLKRFKQNIKQKVFPISAMTGKGIDALLKEVCYQLKRVKTDEKGFD